MRLFDRRKLRKKFGLLSSNQVVVSEGCFNVLCSISVECRNNLKKACTNMAPAFSDAARALKGIVNFGIVDCNQYNRLSFIDSVISLAYT